MVVIVFSSTWKGLRLFHEWVWTYTTDLANFLDSSVSHDPASSAVEVKSASLGSAACGGAGSGWPWCCCALVWPVGTPLRTAVRNRAPQTVGLTPVPAVSPSVPTPTLPTYAPDPDIPPLTTADLATETIPLRLDPDGPGVRVAIPVGWQQNRPEGKDFWTLAKPSNLHYTYSMRVSILSGGTSSKTAAMAARIAQLQDAEDNGDIQDFDVSVQTDDTFEATYAAEGHLRFTTER